MSSLIAATSGEDLVARAVLIALPMIIANLPLQAAASDITSLSEYAASAVSSLMRADPATSIDIPDVVNDTVMEQMVPDPQPPELGDMSVPQYNWLVSRLYEWQWLRADSNTTSADVAQNVKMGVSTLTATSAFGGGVLVSLKLTAIAGSTIVGAPFTPFVLVGGLAATAISTAFTYSYSNAVADYAIDGTPISATAYDRYLVRHAKDVSDAEAQIKADVDQAWSDLRDEQIASLAEWSQPGHSLHVLYVGAVKPMYVWLHEMLIVDGVESRIVKARIKTRDNRSIFRIAADAFTSAADFTTETAGVMAQFTDAFTEFVTSSDGMFMRGQFTAYVQLVRRLIPIIIRANRILPTHVMILVYGALACMMAGRLVRQSYAQQMDACLVMMRAELGRIWRHIRATEEKVATMEGKIDTQDAAISELRAELDRLHSRTRKLTDIKTKCKKQLDTFEVVKEIASVLVDADDAKEDGRPALDAERVRREDTRRVLEATTVKHTGVLVRLVRFGANMVISLSNLVRTTAELPIATEDAASRLVHECFTITTDHPPPPSYTDAIIALGPPSQPTTFALLHEAKIAQFVEGVATHTPRINSGDIDALQWLSLLYATSSTI